MGRAAARIWAAHWLLIVGSVLVFASAVTQMGLFRFQPSSSWFAAAVAGKHGTHSTLSLLSYGRSWNRCSNNGLVLLWRSATYLALVAAAILIALWVAAPCQIAFQQPALLSRLIAETQELSMIRDFTKTYLPTDYGPTEEYPKQV